MCPHTCSRLREPEAKRLKYSERLNGFCASNSAISKSNHCSVVVVMDPIPGSDCPGLLRRAGGARRDARGRPPKARRGLEGMGQAQQGRLAPRAAEERELDRRALGGVA